MTSLNYNYKINYIVILLSVLSIIYILFTNTYFSVENSFIYGAADGESYLKIAEASPYISNQDIQPIHSERFIISYLIGFLAKIFDIEIYLLFRFFVIICILLINYFLIKILFLFNFSLNSILISILLVNLNPYIARFYIANPLMINDLVFHTGALYCIYGLILERKKKFFLGLIISIIARQSALAIFFGIVFSKFFLKDKFFLNKKDILLSLIIIVFFYLIGAIYSSNTITYAEERYDQYYVTILGIFIESKSFKELFIFFVWPFLSFMPLILYSLLYLKIDLFKLKENTSLNYFVLSFCLLIVFQPIIQGIDVGGKNIIRLSTFAFVPALVLLKINSMDKKNNLIINIFFIVLLLVWSSHPTFSKFNFLENYKF